MKDLYAKFQGTPFSTRFADPVQYLRDRKQTEQWIREEFSARGGRPRAAYPITMALGSSRWLEASAPDPGKHGAIRIPLAVFDEGDVSFTYPDGMVSFWFGREKPKEYYLPEYHGKVFTMTEILAIVEEKGLPEDGWEVNLPDDLSPYIEAQVWNHEPLQAFKK
jgi:hypothetical protein